MHAESAVDRMAVFRLCLVFGLVALWSTSLDADYCFCGLSVSYYSLLEVLNELEEPITCDSDIQAICCRDLKKARPDAPSGTYTVTTNSLAWIQIYCEMGLNGGGYTFLSPMALTSLTDSELQDMFTDRTTFLLRVRTKDCSTQPYAVLGQLSPEYSSIPLKLGLSNHDGYNPPINKLKGALEPPFLYFGFLPIVNATNNNKQGLMVNGKRTTFKNCDATPNSQFALYPNFKEAPPTTHATPDKFCDLLFSRLLPNPSGRVIPSDYFFFGETTWGGCGCYKQTNQLENITGFTIGFR